MTIGKIMLTIALLLILAVGCNSKSAKSPPSTDPNIPTDVNTNALIKEGYDFKKTGHNAKALKNFKQACEKLAREKPNSAAHGSCLDDMASVHLRMGKLDKAANLYAQAEKILRATGKADPRFTHGILKRRELITLMKQQKITCAEPETPPTSPTLPYFPDVAKMQMALGKLNPIVAVCDNGPPQAVTIRLEITGDGKLIRAVARGPFADSETGTCVVNKLKAAIPKATLPRFRACFRGFTYPYMVGNHPKQESRQIN